MAIKTAVNIPKHIALTMSGSNAYAAKHNVSVNDTYKMMFGRINEIIKCQAELNIPIVTLYLLTSKVKESEHFIEIMDGLVEFFEKLLDSTTIRQDKIKVSALGKWYDLPGRVVEPIKRVVDETREYDTFFLNLCINYDGQGEITDACKIIARKVQAAKLDPDRITPESIKDGLYSSNFLPPDIIIKTGTDRKLNGFLLWDSKNAHIYFSGKLWPEFEKKDMLKAIKEWNSVKK